MKNDPTPVARTECASEAMFETSLSLLFRCECY